jgi:hypothetical protein
LRGICILAAVALALGAAVERRARVGQAQLNRDLRLQMDQMHNPLAEDQRLSAMAAQVESAPPRPRELLQAEAGSDEQSKELTRLRNEVDALQQQHRELERLRADTVQVLNNGLKSRNTSRTANDSNAAGSPGFEILSASYGTANTNMDVAAELQDRVRGNRLKAVASNNIKGDPDFGQVKYLTVVYRVGGVIQTNEFREGDVVILPNE